MNSATPPSNVTELLRQAVQCMQAGRFVEAEQACLALLDVEPRHAIAHFCLGSVCGSRSDVDEAVVHFRRALELDVDNVDVCIEIARFFEDNGLVEDALSCYERIGRLGYPDAAAVQEKLGTLHGQLGRLREAAAAFEKAIELKPESAAANFNLALVRRGQNDFAGARSAYRRTLEIEADHRKALTGLGALHEHLGELDDAFEYYRRAHELAPDDAGVCARLGVVSRRSGRIEDAIEWFDKSLQLDPGCVMALCSYVYLAKNICDWETTASLSRRLDAVNRTAIERGEKPPEPPFSNMTRHADPALNRTIARAWAREAAERMVGEPAAFDFMARRSRRDRLRIGYLSNNFGDHPVALLMQSLYGLHDRDRFEVFCYSYGKDDGSRYRTKIEHDCDEFVDIVESSDRDSARKIFADGIDILVDLVGHTQDSRLTICAYRPAPIQVHYLGYPGTTGADYIDYLITDRIVTPEAEADLYDEKFAYMPHGYQINDCPAELPASRYKRRDFGVPEKSFVFCCFNRGYKIEPEIFDAWMGMLREVDDSVLWLVRGGEPGDANLRRAAGQRGVDPDRLIFAEPLRLEHHLGRVQLADLALDTHIYNGGATTSHTLTSGVPLITIRGPHFLSRMSASVLIGAGLPELVAAERREYQELAIRLARDPSELASLRARVAQCRRSSPVFDTLRFVTDLESRYEKMWEIFQSGEEPRQIG